MWPQEDPPAMSSSPEAVFMDQLYLAIIDVGQRMKSRIAHKYRHSTVPLEFTNVMYLLDMLKHERGGAMLHPGVSRWDWEVAAFGIRPEANEHLCMIGTVFANGLAKRVSKNTRDKQRLVGPVLPALLASDQAGDISDFRVNLDHKTAMSMIKYVINMTNNVAQLAAYVRNDPHPPPIRGGILAWTPGLRVNDESPTIEDDNLTVRSTVATKKKCCIIRHVKSIFNLGSKKDA